MSDVSRVEEVFLAAIDQPDPDQRAKYLDGACGDDADLRRRVETLLAAQPHADGFLEPVDPGKTHDYVQPETQAIGTMIANRYSLVEVIGEGGMGTVWRAKQTEPVKRYVALKLIKPGMDSKQVLARFEAERQALAMMDHPNIARILDGGIHDNRPFFVMELVKGTPITEFCDARKLTPQQRLELFLPVCQAIQHAHQKGIIHRDIKPSNVLIALYDDQPVPKVIDFGVAKATGGALTQQTIDTGFGGVVGTPQYMSPEQATFNNLDIDTRSDVYSLGTLLYELLAGSPPFSRPELEKRGLLEILRVVREEEPPRPSTKLSTADAKASISANRGSEPAKLTALMKNELDWIVMKALEKDRARRYETANGFAADVSRYLSGEAVQAHPPSTAYRVKKFVRRNKVQVIAASLVFFAILAGMAGTTLALVEAKKQEKIARDETTAKEQARIEERQQRELAEAQQKRAEEAEDETLRYFSAATDDAVRQLLGSRPTLGPNEKVFIELTLKRWQVLSERKGDGERGMAIRASGHFEVAGLWSWLGNTDEATSNYQSALDIYKTLAESNPADTGYRSSLAKSLVNRGSLFLDKGKVDNAKMSFDAAIKILKMLVEQNPVGADYFKEDLAKAYSYLSHAFRSLGKPEDALIAAKEALDIKKELADEYPHALFIYDETTEGLRLDLRFQADLASGHLSFANLLSDLGKQAEAEVQYRKALALFETLSADRPDVPEYRRPAIPEYRSDLATSHCNLGTLLKDLGKQTEAEEQHRKALAIREKLAADFPVVPDYRSSLADSHNHLGSLLAGLGKRAEAEESYCKAMALEEKLAADFPAVPNYKVSLGGSYCNYGIFLRDSGKPAESLEWFGKAIEALTSLHKKQPEDATAREFLRNSHFGQAMAYDALGKRAEAEEQYKKVLALEEKLAADFPALPGYRSSLANSHNDFGGLLVGMGNLVEAEEQFRKAMAIQEKLVADFPAVPDYRVNLGGNYCNFGILIKTGGKPADALAWFDKAIKILLPVHEAEPRAVTAREFLRNTHASRARAYDALGKLAEAVKDWDKAVELSPKEEQPIYCASRATSRLKAGQVAEAVAEVVELAKSDTWKSGQWYNFACIYAVASGKVADKKHEYADRAMQLLAKTVKAGYKDAAHMQKDPDLDPLREREDFKKLLAELEKQNPPMKELLPLPKEKK